MISTVLVGTDGSPQAQAAVKYAADLTAQIDGSAVIVHASGLLEQLPAQLSPHSVPTRTEAERLLATDWSDTFRQQNLTHRCVFEDGPPLLVLPRVAKAENVDLIILGSHGRGNSAIARLGSTAHGLLESSPIPVLVLPVRDELV